MAKLFVIATPIGNLGDITLRALEVFKTVDTIICEDTRVTAKLLKHYEIKKPLLSYHQHSGQTVSQKVIKLLSEGKDLAYVSDAGTPGIQDPGNKLISELVNWGIKENNKIEIIPIPGASAVTTLASVSGLPTDSFLFLGFLPKKKGKQKALQEILDSSRTVIFYESGHRILKTLEELVSLFSHPEFSSGSKKTLKQVQGDKVRKIVIGRELTKKFETIYRGNINEVLDQLNKGSIKGEFVVIVAGR